VRSMSSNTLSRAPSCEIHASAVVHFSFSRNERTMTSSFPSQARTAGLCKLIILEIFGGSYIRA
jgi:hypothetical protein